MKKRILSAFCAFTMLITMAGCGTTSDNAETTTTTEAVTEAPTPVGPQNYIPTDENVKLLGRAFYDDFDEELICAYSGTGCEFTFTGTSVKFNLKGDSAAKANNEDNAARYAIYVDGERTQDLMLDEYTKTITAFESDAETTAVISLVKLSETANSTIAIKSIDVEGTIAPTAEKDLYIEFVGDSITCGYGVDDEDRNHHFSTSTAD